MIEFFAALNRCAVCLDSFGLTISNEKAIMILIKLGFRVINYDLLKIAEEKIGMAEFRKDARMNEIPWVFSSSTFTKWLYSSLGIRLPKNIAKQMECGIDIGLSDIKKGDLIFTSESDAQNAEVGLVGYYTGRNSVIYAGCLKEGVTESPLEVFIGGSFKGARRYVPDGYNITTFMVPLEMNVKTSSDVKRIILQNL